MPEEKLLRKLSFWHIWAIGVGAVIGDGIFLLIGEGVKSAGPLAIIAYVLAGLLMLTVMVALGELAVGMPKAGSLHVWARRVLGPGYGTVAGLAYTAMNIIFLGSVSLANGAISNYFFQWTSDPGVSALIWAVLLVTIVAAIALSGAELTGRVQLALVGTLVTLMAIFGIVGVTNSNFTSANFHPFAPFGVKGLWMAMGMGVYAYIGPLVLLTTGEEAKKITDLPKAMIGAFLTFLVIYTFAMIALIGLVSYKEMTLLESPFTYAAELMFGRVGGVIVNLAAWIAAFTCLVGEIYGSSRLLYGMAEERVIPPIFSKVSKKTRIPWFSIVFAWIIGVLLIILGNIRAFESAYVELCMAGSEMGVIAWIICLLAAAKYKQKFPEEWEKLPWKVPARAVFIPVAFAAAFITMYALVSGDPQSILYTAVSCIVLLLVYYGYSKKHMIIPEKG